MGFHDILGEDEVFASHAVPTQWKQAAAQSRPLVTGDVLRDWGQADAAVLWPYKGRDADLSLQRTSLFWPYRSTLRAGLTFGKTREQRGMAWHEHIMLSWSRTEAPFLLSFAFVATHNHFLLGRAGSVFKHSAPVIKLPKGTGKDEHLDLLAVLNSSTACFWLKQVSQAKGGTDNSSGGGNRWTPEAWIDRYEFTVTKLQEFPLPERLPHTLGRVLDSLAQRLARVEPTYLIGRSVPTRPALDGAHTEYIRTRQRMIALQEELDWQVYELYGLLSEADATRTTVRSLDPDTIPEVQLGERAFEIVLARKRAVGEIDTAWFERHGSTPITEIPRHWPDWYQAIVQARIDIIERRKDIALIERPECKRRWSAEPWEKKEKTALRTWLLDRCEDPALWFSLREGVKQPRTLTVNQLADALSSDADFSSVAALYASDHLNKPDLPLGQVLADVIADEHVPYLAAMRYKDPGLRKRAQWEEVWEKQREEDRTGQRLDIPVPPKYSSADFLKHSYWSHRGKLDVPKERFISYLEAGPDADPTTLLGWAGWDHKDQAQALINLIEDRTEQSGWGTERLTPLIAGLHEVMPWVRQWHGEYDAEWESVPAEDCDAFLDEQMGKHRLSAADLKAWRPVKRARGRKAAASKKASAPERPALGGE